MLDSKAYKKIVEAVEGKKGNNLDDLQHLSRFVHTYQ